MHQDCRQQLLDFLTVWNDEDIFMNRGKLSIIIVL